VQTYQFHVIVEQDEDGHFVAEISAIRACYAQGRTFEEAIENIRDVLQMCLQEMIERGEEIPRPGEIVGLKRVEVAV
jgi:predicted RNase H-like HicB family nuclease